MESPLPILLCSFKATCSFLQNVLLGVSPPFFFVSNHFKHFSLSIRVTSIQHLLYSWPSMTIKSITSPFHGQGQRSFYGQSKRSTKPIFFSSSDWIKYKLGVKVAYDLSHKWLVFVADWPWPSWLAPQVKNHLPQGQILKSTEPYRVVFHIKVVDERFPDQLFFLHYDVIWWRNDEKKKIFTQKFYFFVFHLKIIIVGIC
jgi:hypothetical protein